LNQTREFNSRFREVRKKIAMSILLNAIVPVALYVLLRFLGATDLVGLAVAAAIPVLGTFASWIRRRRVDLIGALAALGFAIALAGAILLGGNTLLLKTHALLLTGPFGLVLLVSALIGKPLLLPVVQLLIPTKLARSGVLEKISSNPAARRKITIASIAIGLVLVGHAVLEVSLAMALPTNTFLIVSKVFTWTTIVVTVILLRWIRINAIKRI
jgi:MFS family permease